MLFDESIGCCKKSSLLAAMLRFDAKIIELKNMIKIFINNLIVLIWL
jgi:hypothetical protein